MPEWGINDRIWIEHVQKGLVAGSVLVERGYDVYVVHCICGLVVVGRWSYAFLSHLTRTPTLARGLPLKLYIYGGLNAGQPLTLRPFSGLGGFSW